MKLYKFLTVVMLLMQALPGQVMAKVPLGMHILETQEVGSVRELWGDQKDEWGYVTIPIRLDQLNRERWQKFMDEANQNKLIPIVRLATRFDPQGIWKRPEKADVVTMARFLSELDWKTDKRRVVVYNEPNHSGEWGGKIAPEEYAEILEFAADWFHTEKNLNYKVLPAGLDSAAANTDKTMESERFLETMLVSQPSVIDKIDAWTSHAYPNPAFAASPYREGKGSMMGWKYELDYLKSRWGKDFDVYITETGWDQQLVPYFRLVNYYVYTLQNVWIDERIKAVTPFVLNGNNGVFEGFSMTTPEGAASAQMKALLAAKEKIQPKL